MYWIKSYRSKIGSIICFSCHFFGTTLAQFCYFNGIPYVLRYPCSKQHPKPITDRSGPDTAYFAMFGPFFLPSPPHFFFEVGYLF